MVRPFGNDPLQLGPGFTLPLWWARVMVIFAGVERVPPALPRQPRRAAQGAGPVYEVNTQGEIYNPKLGVCVKIFPRSE
jgi:hypothetical protein